MVSRLANFVVVFMRIVLTGLKSKLVTFSVNLSALLRGKFIVRRFKDLCYQLKLESQ